MQFKVKRLTPTAKLPEKIDPNAVGWDLYVDSIEIKNGCLSIGTGVAVIPPDGYYFQLFPRSSQSKIPLVFGNSVGVIEPEYTGEILVKLRPVMDIYHSNINEGEKNYTFGFGYTINIGDRIGQLVLAPLVHSEIEEIEDLPETKRGSDGFGSTGK